MINNPLVSVIIPAYNCERYIDETINSVLAQSYSNFELIIVDDGSQDNQWRIIQKHCDTDIRCRCLKQENKGVSIARNSGFNHSCGEFIAFLDADDVWLSDNLEAKLNKFNTGDYGLVHSNGFLINEFSEIVRGELAGCEGRLLLGLLKWKKPQVPGPSSILIRRDVINRIGLFDTSLSTSADQDFFLRVAAHYEIGKVNKSTWKYRLHSQNMHRNISIMEHDILRVYKKATDLMMFNDFWFKRKCFANMYLTLGASWAVDGKNKWRGFYFLIMAIISHPNALISIFDRIMKQWGHR